MAAMNAAASTARHDAIRPGAPLFPSSPISGAATAAPAKLASTGRVVAVVVVPSLALLILSANSLLLV